MKTFANTRIWRMTVRAVPFLLFLACRISDAADNAPPRFCIAVPRGALNGLQDPYAVRTASNGVTYCEGLLSSPISFPAPRVISAKREQPTVAPFVRKSQIRISWCDNSQQAVHLALRATKEPFYALDAQATGQFEWNADSIALWQPEWANIASLASRSMKIDGHEHQVLVPVAADASRADTYVFLVRSAKPPFFARALLEPTTPGATPVAINVRTETGTAPDTWLVKAPFAAVKPGVYLVTFQQGIDQAGVTAEPVYLLHSACPP